jgi:hypothetical protein
MPNTGESANKDQFAIPVPSNAILQAVGKFSVGELAILYPAPMEQEVIYRDLRTEVFAAAQKRSRRE